MMKDGRRTDIDRLHRAALEREPPERAAFVQRACAGDDELRREVESLLAREGVAGDFLEQPAVELAGAASTSAHQLSGGQELGPYRILELLGRGGMGEVYRARDTRLERDVALKVLPALFAAEPDRLARFKREAQVLASLNHPHIAAIYGLEDAGAVRAIVLELVEGETLAERLRRGPASSAHLEWRRASRAGASERGLPVPEALGIARQIVDALEAAHDRGIVHRDLKPANIKLTPAGAVKVLDFGLAKAVGGDGPGPDLSPAVTLGETREGLVLGTPAYMSPEQARGQAVDKRTDVWSFGCVLYEMLAGRSAFGRNTITDTLAAVLDDEPDWQALPSTTSPSLQRLLRRALAKDRKNRLRDAGDIRFAIEDSAAEATAAQTPIAMARPRPAWPMLAATGLVALLFLAGGYMLTSREQPARSNVVTVHRLTDFDGLEEFPTISPDGKTVAFSADHGGTRQIWIRLIAGGPALPITSGPEEHINPRWAPDSASLIAFSPAGDNQTDGTLWEVSSLGGPRRRIASSRGSADISPDGREIAFFRDVGERVELVVATREGSSVRRLVELPGALVNYLSPRWSPDQKWVAFVRIGTDFTFVGEIFAVPAQGGEPRLISPDENFLRGFDWLPDSSGILYSSARGATIPYAPRVHLWTVSLDGGEPRQVTFGDTSYVEPDMNSSGMIVAGVRSVDFDIWKFPIDGSPEENVRRAARVTRQTAYVATPSPSPDDSELVYLSDSGGHGNLWIMAANGNGTRQITFQKDPVVIVGLPRWSPDGSLITFYEEHGRDSSRTGLWLVNPDATGLRYLVAGAWADWSADGKWIYYASSKQGVWHIEKMSPDGGTPVTVRTDNALAPIVPAGKDALYYVVRGPTSLDIRVARPENGPSELLYRVPPSRLGLEELIYFQPSISPDGSTLALFVRDGHGTSLFTLPTSGGSLRRLTDFGDRRVSIMRRVSWSSDGKFLFAAVGEAREDVVLLDGLVP